MLRIIRTWAPLLAFAWVGLIGVDANAADRDLCDIVDRYGHPEFCAPHPIGAPVWNADVCCLGEVCTTAKATGCEGRARLYWCELGRLTDSGEVECLWEVPDTCAIGLCTTDSLAPNLVEEQLCCNGDVCTYYQPGVDQCAGNISWCHEGATNDDGTVDCLE